MNNNLLVEQGIVSLIRASKKFKKPFINALDDVIKISKQDGKPIIKKITKETIDDVPTLIKVIKKGDITSIELGKVYNNLLKSPNAQIDVIKMASGDLVGSNNFIKTFSSYATKKELIRELKKRGYTSTSSRIMADEAFKNTKFLNKIKSGGSAGTKPTPKSGTTPKQTPKSKKGITINNVGTFLRKKWVAYFVGNGLLVAGVGVGGYYLKKFFTDNASEAERAKWPPCLSRVLQHINTELSSTSAGDPIVIVPNTDVMEYNNGEGLLFFLNGVVSYRNRSRKGKWVCKGEVGSVNENLKMMKIINEWWGKNKELTPKEMNKFYKIITSNLSGEITSKNLKNIREALNDLSGRTFQGGDAISAISNMYTKYTKRNLLSDIKIIQIKDDPFVGEHHKNAIVKILSDPKYVTTQEDSDEDNELNLVLNQPLGETVPIHRYLEIYWDGSTDSIKSDQEKKTVTTSRYRKCSDFPYLFGCINDNVRDLQKCLGMETQHQTGQYCPITYERLTTAGYDLKQGITKAIYDDVMGKCGKFSFQKKPIIKKTEPIKTPEKVTPTKPSPPLSTADIAKQVMGKPVTSQA